MSQDRLYLLTHAHSVLVDAGKLPEGTRPYSVASHLNKLQDLIMKEIEKAEPENKPKATTTDDDDIPF